MATSGFNPDLTSGIGGILSGLFGDSGSPYKEAESAFRDFLKQGQNIQNPFYQMGISAIPQLRQWLARMKDPSGFINQLMGGYQESPYAKYEQEQAMRAAQNLGSVGNSYAGGTGSTPLMQFAQQNARNISSQDMNQWLQNVLGINTQYGQGIGSMVSGGQNAANSITSMLSDFGKSIAEMRYGQKAGELQDRNNLWGGLINAGSAILPMFL